MKEATPYAIETTRYGRDVLTAAELYELHREVSQAAARAYRDDPIYKANHKMGIAASKARAPHRPTRSEQSLEGAAVNGLTPVGQEAASE